MKKFNKVYYKTNVNFEEQYIKILTDSNFYSRYKKDMDVYGENIISISSHNNMKNIPLESMIIKYAKPLYDIHIEDFMKRVGLWDTSRYEYEFSWQVYDPNIKTNRYPMHDHWSVDQNIVFSFVHFLKTNADKCFRFVGDYSKNYEYVNEQDGDLIFFPSWIRYEVLTPKSDIRCIMAGNIIITDHTNW